MKTAKLVLLIIVVILVSACSGPPPKMAGDKWAALLRSADVKERKKAAFTLGNIGPSDPAAFPALIDALCDRDPAVRCEAILALLKFGKEAEDVLPHFKSLQERDKDAKVRRCARKAVAALRKIADQRM